MQASVMPAARRRRHDQPHATTARETSDGTTQNLCQHLELGERLLGLGDVIRCQRDCHDRRQQASTRRSPSRLRYGAIEPTGCGRRVALPESQERQPGLYARSQGGRPAISQLGCVVLTEQAVYLIELIASVAGDQYAVAFGEVAHGQF